MQVEVGEGNRADRLLDPGDRSDPDRAVATEHERRLVRLGRLLDPTCRVGDDLDDPLQVLSATSLAVRSPPPRHAIAVVTHVDGVVAK